MLQHLYVMVSDKVPDVKIGITQEKPTQRANRLRKICGDDTIRVYRAFSIDAPRALIALIESIVLSCLYDLKYRDKSRDYYGTEWFSIDRKTAYKFIAYTAYALVKGQYNEVLAELAEQFSDELIEVYDVNVKNKLAHEHVGDRLFRELLFKEISPLMEKTSIVKKERRRIAKEIKRFEAELEEARLKHRNSKENTEA